MHTVLVRAAVGAVGCAGVALVGIAAGGLVTAGAARAAEPSPGPTVPPSVAPTLPSFSPAPSPPEPSETPSSGEPSTAPAASSSVTATPRATTSQRATSSPRASSQTTTSSASRFALPSRAAVAPTRVFVAPSRAYVAPAPVNTGAVVGAVPSAATQPDPAGSAPAVTLDRSGAPGTLSDTAATGNPTVEVTLRPGQSGSPVLSDPRVVAKPLDLGGLNPDRLVATTAAGGAVLLALGGAGLWFTRRGGAG